LKKGYKGREDEEEDVRSYWMALSKKKILDTERDHTLWRTRFGRVVRENK
jgi:hypothetical protein